MNLFATLDADATDFAKRNGFFQDEAIRAPIVVSKHGRPKTVLIAYEEFVRLRERDRQAYSLTELPEEVAQAILDATVPPTLEE
ncbi:type II toxin-antitoxin system prevent-host-death family antitoxin [Methylobacterium sp. J-076]|uniref:type II toxin-antitoxin system prevent-host-death family antitoxin n=1 Tax=Methylobacterium sp. J-076 TaxID=2836655 RepID=UPI001FB89532|nr:type II toxin-antitoxin system prevent-host-death family antitoxin [Methylobacterium sp. J-076]MCJ2011455.1 type II toxin-antitoxin system prevent-host-death family antitoxin [Methylobacterium sp. J-076]